MMMPPPAGFGVKTPAFRPRETTPLRVVWLRPRVSAEGSARNHYAPRQRTTQDKARRQANEASTIMVRMYRVTPARLPCPARTLTCRCGPGGQSSRFDKQSIAISGEFEDGLRRLLSRLHRSDDRSAPPTGGADHPAALSANRSSHNSVLCPPGARGSAPLHRTICLWSIRAHDTASVADAGRPRLPIRLMASLSNLKHSFKLTDEELVQC